MKQLLKKHSQPKTKPTTTNRAGGEAFLINDAATKLITMTGGSFFAEPKYYNDQVCKLIPNKDLPARLQVINDKVSALENTAELDSVAKDVIGTAFDILNGSNPEDLFIIARWLRAKMNIRLTPQVLLVIASSHNVGKQFVRSYAPSIVVRPDEIKTCLLLHRFFFGKKLIPNCLGKGLSDAMSRFGEAALMKYNTKDFPTWKDVLRWLPRKKGTPLSQALTRYFTHDEVSDEIPVCQARKRLNQLKDFNSEAKDLIVRSHANWEVVLSQFGNKKEVWEHLIKADLIGYMALLRNLRNIAQAGADVTQVCKKIADRQEVLKSKQLPFRFASALKATTGVGVGYQDKLGDAIFDAMEAAMENIPEMPGVTAIFADNSGSMGALVSQKSQVTCLDAANILCAMAAKRCETSYVCAFATDVGYMRNAKRSSVGDIFKTIPTLNTNGWSTNGHRCVEWLEQQNIKADRIILVSDMQLYNGSLQNVWERYSRNNPKCHLHTIHINAYGDSAVESSDRVHLMGGFSEKVFTTILGEEGVLTTEEGKQITTIEQIRQEFALK
jgi:hypothetical protein